MSTQEQSKYYSLEAESALLGALLLNNDLFDDINLIIKPEYFYASEYSAIYNLIHTIVSKGQKADILTVSHLAALNPDFKDIITLDYLSQIIVSAPNFDSVKDYAEIIKDYFIRRELIKLFESAATSLSTTETATEAINHIERDIFQLAEHFFMGNNISSLGDSLSEAFNNIINAKNSQGMTGIPTKFKDLDKALGGLQKSDLLILAGRPAMGKTALATNIAYNIAKENNSCVLLFSLEMSAEQLSSRILSHETGINSDALRKGLIKEEMVSALAAFVAESKKTPLFIDDASVLTVTELRSKARKFKRTHNLSLIVIDYLQLMSGSKKNDNRVNELSEITRGLKSIAKELNVPIIALSQLSRNLETREDKKPVLSDLRESGSIEQDADQVLFLYREEYYLKRQEPLNPDGSPKTEEDAWNKWNKLFQKAQNLATLILAKNRHGPTSNIILRFNPNHTKFEDYDGIHNNNNSF